MGTWHDGDGIIQFSGSGGSYQGHMSQANSRTCGSRDPDIHLTGGYGRYSGTIAFYRTDTCAAAGTGTYTVSVAPGALSASWHAEQNGNAFSGSYVRQGAVKPGSDYVNRARTNLGDPCDIKSSSDIAGGGGDPDACGKTTPKQTTAANGAAGILCAIQTLLSGPLAPLQTHDCVKNNPPPKRANASTSVGARRSSFATTSGKRGTYKGFTTPVGRVGANPTKKQLIKAAKRSANFLLRGKRPPGANKISLAVAGKSTAITQDLVLSCVDGTQFPMTIDGLALTGRRGFKDGAEDTFAASAIKGRFLTAKLHRKHRAVVAGGLYVSVSVKQHGPCASFVAFAARGPRVH